VDGVLREYQRIPKALQNSVASRIKILSDMDIAERRAPFVPSSTKCGFRAACAK